MLVEQNEGPLRDRLVEHTTQQGAQRAVVDRPDTRHYGKTRIGDPGCMRRYIRGLWCGRRSLQVCGVWPSSSAPARALRTVNTRQHLACSVLPAVLNPCGLWRRQTLGVIECHTHGISRVPGSRQMRLQPARIPCVHSRPSPICRSLERASTSSPSACLRAHRRGASGLMT